MAEWPKAPDSKFRVSCHFEDLRFHPVPFSSSTFHPVPVRSTQGPTQRRLDAGRSARLGATQCSRRGTVTPATNAHPLSVGAPVRRLPRVPSACCRPAKACVRNGQSRSRLNAMGHGARGVEPPTVRKGTVLGRAALLRPPKAAQRYWRSAANARGSEATDAFGRLQRRARQRHPI